jgi:hypothetical protein
MVLIMVSLHSQVHAAAAGAPELAGRRGAAPRAAPACLRPHGESADGHSPHTAHAPSALSCRRTDSGCGHLCQPRRTNAQSLHSSDQSTHTPNCPQHPHSLAQLTTTHLLTQLPRPRLTLCATCVLHLSGHAGGGGPRQHGGVDAADHAGGVGGAAAAGAAPAAAPRGVGARRRALEPLQVSLPISAPRILMSS